LTRCLCTSNKKLPVVRCKRKRDSNKLNIGTNKNKKATVINRGFFHILFFLLTCAIACTFLF
jgi:hypothetical protein